MGSDAAKPGKAASSSGPIGRGAGSKNLSRMNKPQELEAKSKATQQIPISIFWNQVECFFKPIDDSDMKFLADPSVSPRRQARRC